jgi:hypothetical protein
MLTLPNLSRLAETYIRIAPQSSGSGLWAPYVDLLRLHVAPLVVDLRKAGLVGWFSFLVHDRTSGVPTAAGDDDAFVHLRFELVGSTTLDQLASSLPEICMFTRAHGPITPESILPADFHALRAPELPHAWALFGASSEWTLDFVTSHRDGQPIPLQNVAQFLHYLGNQLMIRATTIPMP